MGFANNTTYAIHVRYHTQLANTNVDETLGLTAAVFSLFL